MRKNKTLPLLSSIIVTAILSYVLLSKLYFNKQSSTDNTISAQTERPTPEFAAIKANAKTQEITYEFPARATAYKIADIRPQIDGVIVKRIFKEGSFVNKGDKLYIIDPAEQIAILAPISGYISRSFVTDGTLVTANQTDVLATITQLDPIYIDIPVPNEQLAEIKKYKNKIVKLIINDTEYPHTGSFLFAETTVNQTTGTTILRTLFKNPNHELLSGMYVKTQIIATAESIITLPQRTVHHRPDGSKYVWLVTKDGLVTQQDVKTSDTINNKWIVTDGIKEQDIVLYEGFQKISENSAIRPNIIE